MLLLLRLRLLLLLLFLLLLWVLLVSEFGPCKLAPGCCTPLEGADDAVEKRRAVVCDSKSAWG